MTFYRKYSLALAAILATAGAPAFAEPIRLGVLTDMSGMNYDLSGQGSVVAAQMAVEDFGGKLLGEDVEVIVGDHQNKPDIGAGIVRRWIDENNVKAVLDMPTSSVALAALEITRQADIATLFSTASSSDITGKFCSPSAAQWTYNTYALANGTGRALTEQGGKKWFFLTSDYAFGHALERDTGNAVIAAGGSVVGAVRHPRETADFSSYLLQAQASGADVIGLANSALDTVNSLKQAKEFGITDGGQRLASLLMFLTDVKGIGLEAAQGLTLTSAFYWDMDDQTREWSARFGKRMNGKMPTMVHAGVYSSVMNFLKAAEASKSLSGTEIMNQMRKMDLNDFFARNAKLREDGQLIHDMYLFEVKTPAESKGEWDLYKLVRTIPGKEAFQTLDKSECVLVKK